MLATVQGTVGIIDDSTIKASHGLSGGGGGGLMALSTKFGRDRDGHEAGD